MFSNRFSNRSLLIVVRLGTFSYCIAGFPHSKLGESKVSGDYLCLRFSLLTGAVTTWMKFK